MKVKSKVGGAICREAKLILNKDSTADVVLHYDEALDVANDFSIKEEE